MLVEKNQYLKENLKMDIDLMENGTMMMNQNQVMK